MLIIQFSIIKAKPFEMVTILMMSNLESSLKCCVFLKVFYNPKQLLICDAPNQLLQCNILKKFKSKKTNQRSVLISLSELQCYKVGNLSLLSGTGTYYETLNRLFGEGTLRWPISDHAYRRTGVMRTAGPKRHDHGQHRHNPMKHKRKPPRGMHLNYEDLQVIVNGPLSQADALLKSLDQELVSLKRQVVICSC